MNYTPLDLNNRERLIKDKITTSSESIAKIIMRVEEGYKQLSIKKNINQYLSKYEIKTIFNEAYRNLTFNQRKLLQLIEEIDKIKDGNNLRETDQLNPSLIFNANSKFISSKKTTINPNENDKTNPSLNFNAIKKTDLKVPIYTIPERYPKVTSKKGSKIRSRQLPLPERAKKYVQLYS